MTIVKFGNPRDITPSGLDGKKIKFPFTVTVPAHGALRDKFTEHSIVVGIAGTLLGTWGFGRWEVETDEIAKYLFEFAREEALGNLIDGSLEERHEIKIHGGNAPYKNPFEPSKLSNPSGATYQVDVEEARRFQKIKEKEERGFGFQIRREDV